MFKPYKQILSAVELKALHDEAAQHGMLEVGISKGKILYAWDEGRANIRVISTVEAATRLNYSVQQIDKIIETDGQVVFEEPKVEEVADAGFLDKLEEDNASAESEEVVEEAQAIVIEAEEPKSAEPVAEEALCEEPKIEATTVEPIEAPQSAPAQEEHVEKVKSVWQEAFETFAQEIAAAAERFQNKIK